MTGESAQDSIDPARARLIESIYEAVLRPEHYDVFMTDWAAHLDIAAERLASLRNLDGLASETLSDPLIEGHFKRAFSMLERMGRGPATEAMRGLVDTDAQPLFRIDRAGALHGRPSNDGDTDKLAPSGSIRDLPTLLARLEADSAARLEALIAGLWRAPVVGQLAVLSLSGSAVEETGTGEHQPQTEAAAEATLLVALTRRDADGGVELAIHPLALHWSEAVAHALSASFRLSPRELDVVRALASGQDLSRIARQTGRSLNTLRAQLKSVFQKTGTGSQVELMRVVSALILFAPGASAAVIASGATLDAGKMETIPGHDGQPVPVHVIGPETGRPCVFVHGMLDGIAVTRHVARALAAADLRLIAPVRRNFGQAVPDPRLREAPEIFARDMESICNTLNLERFVLLGHMAGAIPAFAAAARLGPRVAGVLSISGGVPIKSLRQFALMSPRQRAVAYTARFAPALLPAILRAGIAQIDGKDAVAFMSALYPEGSRDREIVADPDIAAAIIDGYRFSVAQGEQAFRNDSWHVTRDWSALVAACACPVRLVHGAQDPVVRIETVRDFVASSNQIRLDELPGEGQLLFYSQPQFVLSAVAEMAAA